MRISVPFACGMSLLVLAGWLTAAQTGDDKELKLLEGTYVMVSGDENGAKLPDDVAKTASLIMAGNKHTVKVGKETIIGTHKINSSKTPKEIDATDTEGPLKGKTYLGIYKFEKDVFTVYFSPPGKDRPKDFANKTGPGELLHVWKKK